MFSQSIWSAQKSELSYKNRFFLQLVIIYVPPIIQDSGFLT